jgi:small-conductance mechanosensitive channel
MSITTMALSIFSSSNDFSSPIIHGVNNVIVKLPGVIFGVMIGILLIGALTRALKVILTVTISQVGLRDVIVSIVRIFLWLFLVISVLQVFYPNVILFFSGSIAAIGLAMAAGGSTLISDIIAGIFLARDIDFNVGDEIIAGETPTQGVIESMDARRVRLRDDNGVLHVMPNSIIERKEWVVVRRRSELTAIAKAARALKSVAREHKAAASKRQVRLRNNDQ